MVKREKCQTRRAVSLSGDAYARLQAYAQSLGRPLANVLEQDLLLPFFRAVEATPVASESTAGPALEVPAPSGVAEVAGVVPTMAKASAPRHTRGREPLCALCVQRPGVVSAPLGPRGAPVWICAPCDGEHPRQGRYGFGEHRAPSPGVGPGNHHTPPARMGSQK